MLVAFFVVALFAIIVAMHRGVTRGANAELRARFDAEGQRGELSRRLMRDAGYRV
ncbi:Pilus assembly protein [Burkholderia orbicola]